MYSEELKHTLESKPSIKSVWFRPDGLWYFRKQEGLKEVSREEILGEVKQPKVKEDVQASADKPKRGGKKGKGSGDSKS